MNGIIYILSPANILSGGVSSLHNLCMSLNFNSFDAKMVYTEIDENFIKNTFQKKFDTPRAEKIIDDPQNTLIVPETMISHFEQYPQINKMVYWLSIKFFFKNRYSYNSILKNNLLRKFLYPENFYGSPAGILDSVKQRILYYGVKKSLVWEKQISHLTNSAYLFEFCKFMGAKNIYLLYNPLVDEVFAFKSPEIKKNIILLGARTSKAIEYFFKLSIKGYQIIRIKNRSLSDTYKLMSESLVYVDLSISNRDRTPREAALLGCIIFTSSKGSAGNPDDVPIPLFYKINPEFFSIIKLIRRLKYALKNYEQLRDDFKQFNIRNISEKHNFNQAVGNLFHKIIK